MVQSITAIFLNIYDKIIETDKQESEEIRGPSTSSPLSNMKCEPISPCLGLKSGSEDDIEIVEILEKGKDSITDKDKTETAMNTTYVIEIEDNQDEDQEGQTIEIVQDKMTPKLTKDQMATNDSFNLGIILRS